MYYLKLGILVLIDIWLLFKVWQEIVVLLDRALALSSKELKYRSTFDVFWAPLFLSSLVAVLLARIFFIISNISFYRGVSFSIFPYIRLQNEVVWFTYMPWRVLRFGEGINISSFLVTLGILYLVYLFRVLRYIRKQVELTAEFSRFFVRLYIKSAFYIICFLLVNFLAIQYGIV